MPTMLCWTYGGEREERRAEQLSYPGDDVYSDELGGDCFNTSKSRC